MLLPVSSRGDSSCPNLESVACGNVNISYPFWLYDDTNGITPYCGYQRFMLTWESGILILQLGDRNYSVLDIDYNDTVVVSLADDVIYARRQLPETCSAVRQNVAMPSNISLSYEDDETKLTLFFNCSSFSRRPAPVSPCLRFNEFGWEIKYSYDYISPTDCHTEPDSSLLKPYVANKFAEEYAQILRDGFLFHWMGANPGDDCGHSTTDDALASVCFCSGGKIEVPQDARIHPAGAGTSPAPERSSAGAERSPAPWRTPVDAGRKKHTTFRIGIVIGALAAVLLLCGSILFCRYKKKRNYLSASKTFTSSASSGPSSMDPEKYSVHFQTNLFSYNELQEATNGFDKELGDGGFGTVYKGKLRDGRVVAVKRLYENNSRRLEQFMNEIEILSHVRHQNLVDLYGWTSRDCKELLLVYEFVPNGTVADHLHGSRAGEGILTWPMRLKIAIETAEALAYLHAIDPPIIHRDIKTNNILLDSSFHVKVADFGLSRWFPTNATHVSTVPQGTPGYLDPEYHECYQLTHKSDVYSFGVVLVELLSSKPAVDFTRHRKEINLANLALNRIQNGELDQLVDEHLGYQSNQAAMKMVTMVAEVAFRCLQVDGDMRPTMKEVLEALVAIQSKGYTVANGAKEAGDNEDDAGLLENIAPMSPDTVMNQWVSSTTTPNTSKN